MHVPLNTMHCELINFLTIEEVNMCKYDFFRDGAVEVGVFCVLHNVLQQLRMDKEVDIFTAVRQIQTRRPEVISKLVNSDLNIKITTTDRMFFSK